MKDNELRKTIKTIMDKSESKTERYMFPICYMLHDLASSEKINAIQGELYKERAEATQKVMRGMDCYGTSPGEDEYCECRIEEDECNFDCPFYVKQQEKIAREIYALRELRDYLVKAFNDKVDELRGKDER